MCIIAYKPAGTPAPASDVMHQCFESNPDGAGVAIIRPASTTVEIYKGFMYDIAFQKFCSENISPDDIAVYHWRIATAGLVDAGNCHPFPVSGSRRALRATSIKCRFAFAHNGILGNGADGLSDTQIYIKYCLSKRSLKRPSESLITQLNQELSGSRAVLMDGKTHTVTLIGDGWINDRQSGLSFSNSSYQSSPFDAWSEWDALCPFCSSFDTDVISKRHTLIECSHCGCVFDAAGNIWADGDTLDGIPDD